MTTDFSVIDQMYSAVLSQNESEATIENAYAENQ